ncbi:class F sortase [Streptomyces manipurensis]|uniref:class F sortase n=1 Tax=Streptomyces manipurensis TaxID=1077945 RepID=UPI003C6FF2A2
MGMASVQHRKALGSVAAVLGVILMVAAVLLATARADRPSRTADFGASQVGPLPSGQEQPPSSGPVRPEPVASSDVTAFRTPPTPRALAIPGLGLRAPVDPVGVAADGQMEVPENPDRVGWYRYSPAPGADQGSSVIVGHVDAKGLGLGVLFGLNKVRQGDQVQVVREDGTTISYEITARRTLGKKELVVDPGVFDREGPAVLTLITCAGPYLADRGGYQNNLVVTAVEVMK